MISRENALREALSELEEQRARNYAEEERRREALAVRAPEAAGLLSERQALLHEGMQRAFADPAHAREISEDMGRRMEEIGAAVREALRAQGLPEDWLQPVYRCPLCQDTGYVGETVREQCSCLKSAVLNRLFREEGLQSLRERNFARFDERVFSAEPLPGGPYSQRDYMLAIRAKCERYADAFAPGQGRGLLFTGETGTGKTYMLNCVAERVLERGFSTVVVSSYRLSEIMRRYQWNGSGQEQVQDLLTCDLLCIDDLGSEPLRREETISGLYHIVGERTDANLAVAVTTNCSVEQIYERCGDRVAARLCDPGRMQILRFVGQDVRRRAAELAQT